MVQRDGAEQGTEKYRCDQRIGGLAHQSHLKRGVDRLQVAQQHAISRTAQLTA